MSAVTPGIRVPSQERGQAALDRLLAAGSELLAERGYDGLTLADVSKKAGVSYGAMQYRVTTKDALVRAIHESFWEHVDRHVNSFVDAERWDGLTLDELVAAAIWEISEIYTYNPPLLRALSLRAGTDPAILGRVSDGVHRGSRGFTTLLQPRLDAAGHPDSDRTAKRLFTVITGAMATRTTWPEFHDGPLEWEDFVGTICEMALGLIDRAHLERPID